MLFSKRDLKNERGRNLSKRFAGQIGRLLATPSDDLIHPGDSINIPLCYTLISNNLDNTNIESELQKQTFQRIIKSYHDKTGHWLSQEQIIFAAIWQDAKQQAAMLKERLRHEDTPLSTLKNIAPTSLLKFTLLADALQTKQFIYPATVNTPIKSSACSRLLNLSLDEISITEIEGIGREVREDCEKAHLAQGATLEGIETCWRLKIRYEGSQKSLTLKCMPREMLREVFETQHLQKYGTTDKNRVIIIEALEIEVRLIDQVPQEIKQSTYVEHWMSQWQQNDHHQPNLWSKNISHVFQEQFSWLRCPVLNEMLVKLTTKQADDDMPNFFITNRQKGVDEVVIRN